MAGHLRLFAGPNGSGKSTLKPIIEGELAQAGKSIGYYLNPDEINRDIIEKGFIDFEALSLPQMLASEIEAAALEHVQAIRAGFEPSFITEERGRILIAESIRNDYFSSFLSDVFRRKMLENFQDFTFESVMSSPDKIGFLKKAQTLRYKTYLYFVSTETPEINKRRVALRVGQGGHDVPEDKIEQRYYRSLGLAGQATLVCYRSYFFNNSVDGGRPELVAEITPDWELLLHRPATEAPQWLMKLVDTLPL